MKEENLPRMLWRKGKMINIIWGVSKFIRGAEIIARQRNSDKIVTSKQLLKYPVPFEIMDADKRGVEHNDVMFDNPPVEITPPRRIRLTAAMNTEVLRRLNDIDGDIDEWAWWQSVTNGERIQY